MSTALTNEEIRALSAFVEPSAPLVLCVERIITDRGRSIRTAVESLANELSALADKADRDPSRSDTNVALGGAYDLAAYRLRRILATTEAAR